MAQSLKIKLVRSAVASVKKDQTATCRALASARSATRSSSPTTRAFVE